MTTTTRTPAAHTLGDAARSLLWVSLCVGAVLIPVVGLASIVSGRSAALGAASGGAVALVFLLFGVLNILAVLAHAPQMSTLVAVVTFGFQVVLLGAVFLGLERSGLMDTSLSAGWMVAGLVSAAVTWTGAQLWTSVRMRITAFDVELPRSQTPPGMTREVVVR